MTAWPNDAAAHPPSCVMQILSKRVCSRDRLVRSNVGRMCGAPERGAARRTRTSAGRPTVPSRAMVVVHRGCRISVGGFTVVPTVGGLPALGDPRIVAPPGAGSADSPVKRGSIRGFLSSGRDSYALPRPGGGGQSCHLARDLILQSDEGWSPAHRRRRLGKILDAKRAEITEQLGLRSL